MNGCIVIGAGLVGLLTARELALAGLSVRVLERGEIGRESSWAGGGILTPLYPWRYPDAVTVLSRWSQAHYRELSQRLHAQTGMDPEWTPSGLLILDGGEREIAFDWAGRFGDSIVALGPAETLLCEPALKPDLSYQGLWMADVAQVRNPRLLKAVRLAGQAIGVEVISQCEVQGLRYRTGRIRGVETSVGPMSSDCVVVAGGAWSGQVLAGLGIIPEVRPVRGQMLIIRATPGLLRRVVLNEGRYLIPRRDGRVLVGSTMEEVGFDKSTTEAARDELLHVAAQWVPALARYPVELHWSGLRPGSPNGVPYIGEHPDIQGLFVNAGHFRNGVVMAPASARLVADLILGRPPITDPAPYALTTARFG